MRMIRKGYVGFGGAPAKLMICVRTCDLVNSSRTVLKEAGHKRSRRFVTECDMTVHRNLQMRDGVFGW